jgi:HD-GYP domain-containing protein (c-di-GMP phosphodiesterase class II)
VTSGRTGRAASPLAAPPDLGRVLSGLDMIVLKRELDDSFLLLTDPTASFAEILGTVRAAGVRLSLRGASDYLDHFLFDAAEFWLRGEPGRIRSGPWLEAQRDGEPRALEAQALRHNNEAFLIIEHLGAAYDAQVRVLQSARDHLLKEEALEREVLRRTQSIRLREEEIAMRLLAAAATRDGETGSHVRRIGLYAAAIAEALGWETGRIADLRVAAPMHDVGKIGIPDAILRKPGALSEEEFRIMQDHTVIGARMLGNSEIPLLCLAREIALGHHEKWNGRGYPQRLAGEEIPVAARIVTIVDVYDAMVHRRVYKPPIPEPEVLAAMAQGAGRDFDPHLFDVFLGILPTIRAIRDDHLDEAVVI